MYICVSKIYITCSRFYRELRRILIVNPIANEIHDPSTRANFPDTVQLVLNRIELKEDGSATYQWIDLKRHEQSLTFLRAKTPDWIDSLKSCIQYE